MSDETKKDLPAGNENSATFTARIVDTPNQDTNGNYQSTNYRSVVDKRTGAPISNRYYDNWYHFSGTLTSIIINGQEQCIPSDLKVDICVQNRQNVQLKYILPLIKRRSYVIFEGVPQRVDKSSVTAIDPKEIENAHEIYVNDECIETIKIERLTMRFRISGFCRDIIGYMKKSKIKLIVGFFLGVLITVVGGLILYFILKK